MQLQRVCISTYFHGIEELHDFLINTLPPLDYLEIAAVALTDDLIKLCSEKFNMMVVFGSAELSMSRR